jgi:hypothetical protein
MSNRADASLVSNGFIERIGKKNWTNNNSVDSVGIAF